LPILGDSAADLSCFDASLTDDDVELQKGEGRGCKLKPSDSAAAAALPSLVCILFIEASFGPADE
jgi:hypothetical protein